ncbi:PQQ-dependent sugar dehydrogenase [Streptomyces sp. NPDC050433]|uniref:PQQ-dependent sugar dehydrogenase n=1 Tax=Streptomyces sp. NPDC050433 TaxID=3365615 RepID=UPI00379AAB7C
MQAPAVAASFVRRTSAAAAARPTRSAATPPARTRPVVCRPTTHSSPTWSTPSRRPGRHPRRPPTSTGTTRKTTEPRPVTLRTPFPTAPHGAPAPLTPSTQRNPQGIAFDPQGRLWGAELGQNARDELILVKAGNNYGWPICEGTCSAAGMTDPKATWTTAEASPSGIAVVDGAVHMASLRGERPLSGAELPFRAGQSARRPARRTQVDERGDR